MPVSLQTHWTDFQNPLKSKFKAERNRKLSLAGRIVYTRSIETALSESLSDHYFKIMQNITVVETYLMQTLQMNQVY